MDRILSTISMKYGRNFLVFVFMFFTLILSCQVKGSIKSLAGLPVNAEQSVPKGAIRVFGNGAETCVNDKTADTEISRTTAISLNDVLPAVFLAMALLSLIGLTRGKEQPHPRYGNLKIPGTLPLFLQHRRLLI